jgi:hypothetical protein
VILATAASALQHQDAIGHRQREAQHLLGDDQSILVLVLHHGHLVGAAADEIHVVLDDEHGTAMADAGQ